MNRITYTPRPSLPILREQANEALDRIAGKTSHELFAAVAGDCPYHLGELFALVEMFLAATDDVERLRDLVCEYELRERAK